LPHAAPAHRTGRQTRALSRFARPARRPAYAATVRTSVPLLAALLTAMSLVGGCTANARNVPSLRVAVLAGYPHSRAAFTEGLELDGDTLYEGTGMVGGSWVTAQTWPNGKLLAKSALPEPDFGEGVSVIDGTLWELTWRDHDAIARDPRTLVERRRLNYAGEGWGLCHRRGLLVMSDGADTLTFRDPATFAVLRTVRLVGWDNVALNSLACAADGTVYANEWPTDHILHVDPDTGAVLGQIDASSLRALPGGSGPMDPNIGNVLNGITQVPGTDHFLVTGKYWPRIYEVRFVR
jgi:glutamine cyclotransferase